MENISNTCFPLLVKLSLDLLISKLKGARAKKAKETNLDALASCAFPLLEKLLFACCFALLCPLVTVRPPLALPPSAVEASAVETFAVRLLTVRSPVEPTDFPDPNPTLYFFVLVVLLSLQHS